jgi:crotonobetainyl-CoA:carnitine CoA-transferase CaiB-like acyl-CoA transferase
LLDAAGVPAGPLLDIAAMQANPQTLAREMVVAVTHEGLGSVKTLGLPVKFSETPGRVAIGAPVFGQHSREILREHGFAEADIAALIRQGVVGAPGEEVEDGCGRNG